MCKKEESGVTIEMFVAQVRAHSIGFHVSMIDVMSVCIFLIDLKVTL